MPVPAGAPFTPMSLPSHPRWLASVLQEHRAARAALGAIESYPPSARSPRLPWAARVSRWLGASAWDDSTPELPSSYRQRRRSEALATARLDFADALFDVRTPAAAELGDRIAVTRSLHELWHARGEVFGQISHRLGQTEATRRLAALDHHFPTRLRRRA